MKQAAGAEEDEQRCNPLKFFSCILQMPRHGLQPLVLTGKGRSLPGDGVGGSQFLEQLLCAQHQILFYQQSSKFKISMGSLKRRKPALRGEVYGWSSVSACLASSVSTNQGLSARVNYTALLYIRLKHVWIFKKIIFIQLIMWLCWVLVAACRTLQLQHVNSQLLHAGSQFSYQGLNPCSLHWECRVLATGPTGKSPCVDFGACGKVGIPGTDTLWIPRFSCTWQKGFM